MAVQTQMGQEGVKDPMLSPGTRIGPYDITSHLGAGGMGEVFRARDTRLGREVAIKVLPKSFADDPDRVRRFEQEARATAALSHPNVLAVYDVGTCEGQPYLVTELLEGETLRTRIETQDLTVHRSLEIAIHVAEGLAAAHEKGIVHRDLKPENLFVTAAGVVKILDFGLAKLVEPEMPGEAVTEVQAAKTVSGLVLGTVGYMAPEQIRAQPVDARSDIFALGCILYEMLGQRQAFSGATATDTMSAILHQEPPPLTSCRAGLPPSLDGIVRRCLEKRPEERFRSAADLAFDLRMTLKPEDRNTEQQARRRRLPRTAAVAAAGAITLAATVVGWFLFGGHREASRPVVAPNESRIVVLPFSSLGPERQDYVGEGLAEEISSRLAAVSALRVVSGKSAARYAAADASIAQMRDELRADYVLDGTVRWAGDAHGRIRISPQLIRTADDTRVWTEVYERTLTDLFAVQVEIAERVVSQLGATILAHERAGVEEHLTDNVDAYRAYLEARYWQSRPHFLPDRSRKVEASLERAVALAPDFAVAHAELARTHATLYFYGVDLSEGRLEKARRSAERALALAPGSPRVRLALGYYYLRAFRDPERALDEFNRAATGLPHNAEVLQGKGTVFELQGRWEEACNAYSEAAALSPAEPDIVEQLGFLLWNMRRFREADAAFDRCIALAPEDVWGYLGKTFLFWSWRGGKGEGRAALAAMPAGANDWETFSWVTQDTFEGRFEEALQRLASHPGAWVSTKMWTRPKAFMEAQLLELLERPRDAQSAYRTALPLLERAVEKEPGDRRLHSSLGIVYAVLGRASDAVREGRGAVALLPMSQDAYYALPALYDLAYIHMRLGDHQAALKQLDFLLTTPSFVSSAWLRADPLWAPLRSQPGFTAMLAKREVEEEKTP